MALGGKFSMPLLKYHLNFGHFAHSGSPVLRMKKCIACFASSKRKPNIRYWRFVLVEEDILAGSPNGTGHFVLMRKTDLWQKSIGAGDDLSEGVFAIPVERAAKVWMLKKV